MTDTLREKTLLAISEVHSGNGAEGERIADAALFAFRQWLADEGLIIVPAEPTPKMLEANSNCTTPELWAGIGWAAMIAAAPDPLEID
jgi:hypothetical protein